MSIIAGKIKGITIEIAGDTQPLNKALKDVNKSSQDIQKELRQVERLLKFNPGNTELLAQKQKLLGDQVKATKEKLDTLRAAQAQVNEQFKKGEIGEEQYRAFQRELVKTESQLKHFEQQLKSTGMTAEQLGKKLQDAGKKMTDAGKNLSMKVTAPITAAGAASFKFAADLEDAMGASDQIFKGASGSIKTWADSLDSYYGIAESEALTYANTMGAMLQNIGGLSEAEASKQSQILVELAGDLTAMFGGTTESAIQALTGALKGNNSMLDNYGMGVNEATIKTKALEMGLYDGTGQMDLATKQAATLALIMEQTADAQGQAARESEGASGSMRALQTELKNVATKIGEVLLPIITPFIAKIKEMVQRFGELTPEAQKIILIVAGVAAAIGPLLIAFGLVAQGVGAVVAAAGALSGAFAAISGVIIPALSAALGAITLPVAAVVAAFVGLVAAGVAVYKNWDEIKLFAKKFWESLKKLWTENIDALKKGWSEGWKTVGEMFKGWGDSISTAWKKLWDEVKTFLVNWWPVLLRAITGPMGIVATAIYKNWDDIKTKTAQVWNSIKTFCGEWWSTFTNWLKTWIPWDFVKTKWDEFKTKTLDVWNNLKTETGTWWNTFTGWLKTWNPWAAVQDLWNTWKENTIQVWRNLKNDAVTWGSNIIQGMADGIRNKLQTAVNAIGDVVDGIKNKVKTALGIASPSTVMKEYGQDISQGLADGIEEHFVVIETAMGLIVTGVKGKVTEALEYIDGLRQQAAMPITMGGVIYRPGSAAVGSGVAGGTGGLDDIGKPGNVTTWLASDGDWRTSITDSTGSTVTIRGKGEGIQYAGDFPIEYAGEGKINVPGIGIVDVDTDAKTPWDWYEGGSGSGSGSSGDSWGSSGNYTGSSGTGTGQYAGGYEVVDKGDHYDVPGIGKVDKKADGGILTKPKFIYGGESGDEAILPLERLQPMMNGALIEAIKAISQNSFSGIDYDRLGHAVAKNIKPSITQNNTFTSPKPLTPAETAKQNLRVSRRLAMEWGL